MRDYEKGHESYDDPASSLLWRLAVVQRHIDAALDRHRGRIRVLSSCSGDGRDVLGLLARRPDAERVSATLLELHARPAERVREVAARTAGHVEVRTVDAGNTDAYLGAVRADVVLMIGIFGNISDADLQRTIAAAPQLCSRGSTLLWSRGCDRGDRNDEIRAWFATTGFTELDYTTMDPGDGPAVGAVQYDGRTVACDRPAAIHVRAATPRMQAGGCARLATTCLTPN